MRNDFIIALFVGATVMLLVTAWQRNHFQKEALRWEERYRDCQASLLFREPAHTADAVQPTVP